MRLIDLHLTREQLAACLSSEGATDGALHLPDAYDIALGEAVLVRLRPTDLVTGVYLEGVVQWRRATASRGQPKGIGLRLVPTSASRWRYLRAIVDGGQVVDRRRSWRHPCKMPVILVTAPRGSTRIYPCSLSEVSAEGALLAINHRLVVGEEGRCEWAVGARTFAVTLSVVWSDPGRVGARLLWRGREERPAWDALVESVRSSLDALRVDPRSVEASRPEPRRGEGGDLRSTGRHERAIVELPPDPTRRDDPRRS